MSSSEYPGVPRITFVIPTFNEQEFLPRTLLAIIELVKQIPYEIIVVDNGSTDRTAQIASSFAARVLVDPTSTIAGLRNLGALAAHGRFLVFLDADVIITPMWARNIAFVLDQLDAEDRKILTGSTAGISDEPSWIERHWFLPRCLETPAFMNSAHLIISKALFREIGGFAEDHITGEDYELCQRAQKGGCLIENNPGLHVIHEGYPKTIPEFIAREVWHGTQLTMSLHDLLSSRIGIMTLAYWIVPMLGLAATILTRSFAPFLLTLAFIVALCLAATLYKSCKYRLNVCAYFIICNLYLFSRGLSLARKINPLKSYSSDMRGSWRTGSE
jgi:glycosyltransferase involved in cell wall biosynthesis